MESMKIFSTTLFVFFMCIAAGSAGYAQQCTISDMKVNITETGKAVEGAPEWLVSISNACHCPQSNVYVKCKGFNSYETVNPEMFKVEGDNCLINGGKQIVEGVPVKFKFAFQTPFEIVPLTSYVVC